MTIVPHDGPISKYGEVLRWAQHYVEACNWPIFVLGRDKTTLRNCDGCKVADGTHDRERCECLVCHGFYAATRDLEKLERMISIGLASGGGLLALRTGPASGITVIDAEAHADVVDDGAGGQRVTGLDVLDAWEQWVDCGGSSGAEVLGETVRARTGSGGLHLLYATGSEVLKSRNRVLPGVDVKSSGGYVALPCGLDGREWLTRGPGCLGSPAPPSAGLLGWLRAARGHASGSSGAGGGSSYGGAGYDFQRAYREGARGGERDVFFRDLLFRLRMSDHSREAALEVARLHWERCQQVSGTWGGAQWDMPWEHVVGKLDHTWRSVTPTATPEWRWGKGTPGSGGSEQRKPRRIMRLGESVESFGERGQ